MRKKVQNPHDRGRRAAAVILTVSLLLPGMSQIPEPILALADEGRIRSEFSFEDSDGMKDEWLSDEEEPEKARETAADESRLDESKRRAATGADANEDEYDWKTGPENQVGSKTATDSDAKESQTEVQTAGQEATPSSSLLSNKSVSSLGDLWDNWEADFSFLDGQTGIGTKEEPYQIKNKSQLMGLSQLAAMGMRVQPGEGGSEIVGRYDGKYFKLMSSIDLGGMEWNPIGFYQDSSEYSGEITNKFFGHFDGNNNTVSNFKISSTLAGEVGFFGAIEDGSVENLNLKPGKTISGKGNTAILAGSAVNSKLYHCTVNGNVEGTGALGGIGGIAGKAEGSKGSGKSGMVIENCTANVTITANKGSNAYVGGIAGEAAHASIVDCRVETGDNKTARIQGQESVVGGIVGFQNDADIYNAYVSGTIGGSSSRATGGITGQYGSGHLKVARFEGEIGESGDGRSGHRGTFIGHREAGNFFRYGEDVAYLFTDDAKKIAFNICGSEIPDDNEYTYGAHIGYSHKGDNFYSLAQGGKNKDSNEKYYYQELEDGILEIIDEDHGGMDSEKAGYELDHFAPNDSGLPTRGYLITVPQINTVSAGSYFYDVASLEVRGNSSYYRTIDKTHRGAVAPGKSVTVTTSPNNTADAKFQMKGAPAYIKNGKERETSYVSGGEYTFTMPEENTQVNAVYKRVAVRASVIPDSYNISVVEERAGNRKSPVKTTKVLNNEGKLIATYINGELEQGTRVQPVMIQAIVDANNDVEDSSVKWSVDDPDLIHLEKNDDEDEGGYTGKSASLTVNLQASFFTDTIRRLEREQAEQNYQYPIQDTIYGAGHQNGGVAILTASTRPAASFEGRPCTANSRLNVTFQIKDKTYVANEVASLDKPALDFTVTRKLTGNRKSPEETIAVTPPQSLSAEFQPDFFDKKDITWKADDNSLIAVRGEDKSASVEVRADAKWIQDIIATDTGIHSNNPYAVLKGNGERTAVVTVAAGDMLGNRRTASCPVAIKFVTDDQTRIYVENVAVSPEELTYDLGCIKSGNRNSPVVSWTGIEEKRITAKVTPKEAFNKKVRWEVSDDALQVDEGIVTVNTAANWIQQANRSYPFKGEHTALVTAVTDDGDIRDMIPVKMTYQLTDNTYLSGSSSHSGGGGGKGSGGSGGKAGSGMNGVSVGSGPAKAAGPAAADSQTAGGITGDWIQTADGHWTFSSGKRSFADEWAYILNPYAGLKQTNTDWFRFDKAGNMITGWFADTDGKMYYLWPISDGTLGHMAVGWQWIAGENGLKRCYYFNPLSDGTKGAMYSGGITPDGLSVNEKGEWTADGIVQEKN